ncbi:MAG TPA: FAD-dependent oxidoreductase [Solirubrobacterales bacterium]|nr:FAD-dependent oxidoreductase [Solirubrobacterales bacterium]
MSRAGTVIVGGGLAAQRVAEGLRRRGYEDPVRIVCGEPEPPYDRPPLSKELLAGTVGEAEVAYRPAGWYEENEVELLLGAWAEELDAGRRRVGLDSGASLPYENLVIATGGEPRRLRFLAGANVHELRTLADLRRLRSALVAGSRLAIVGAGFIGQEVAATARALGVEVTVVEALPVPLEPIVGPRLGRWFADMHREEGVRIIAGAALESARGSGDRIEELVLADGRRVECDAVLVGIGTVPATGWLEGSGLGNGGVPVDAGGRAALPGVFAAGDACLGFEPRRRTHLRTEHWDAAAWQGAAVAKAILGEEPGRPPLPSFWSDQYGVRVQCVGHPQLADGVAVEGDPAGRDFQALLSRGGVPVAGLAVGRPRAIPAFRKQIEGAVPALQPEKEAA